MKHLLLLFTFLIVGSVSAQKISWMTMNEALEAQKTQPKKIFMDVYTIWCGPCKLLDKNTFSDKKVIEFINENYYAVKFNAILRMKTRNINQENEEEMQPILSQGR